MGEEKAYLVDMVSVDCRILTEKLNRLKLNFIGHEIKRHLRPDVLRPYRL